MNTSKKNIYGIIGGVVVLVLICVGLVFVARGKPYNLTVLDPVMGPDNAPVVIEEHADFQCPACKRASPMIEEILKQYPTQVKVVYRDFPLPDHPYAAAAAAAGLCSAQQGKFKEFYQKTFDTQDDWSTKDRQGFEDSLTKNATDIGLNLTDFNTCRNSREAQNEVARDFTEGVKQGIDSTPTFFLNGEKVEAPSLFQWIQKINDALQKKGLTPENQPKT